MTAGPFADLDPRTRRLIDYEQTVNDRLLSDRFAPIDERSNTVRTDLRPEARGVWGQEVVWLPSTDARVYGDPDLGESLQLDPPEGRMPLLLHPQAPAAHRRLALQHGREGLAEVRATPTASARTVLAWSPGRPPVMLKLSMGAVVARMRRSLREVEVARAVMMTAILDRIPRRHAEQLGLDWCREPGGVVAAAAGSGWLLRDLPRSVGASGERWLIPMFSLVSARGDRPPLLVELIRNAGRPPLDYVTESVIRPYVEALAYLLFVQGIQTETHMQNVLAEMDADGVPTGRLVLRDLSDIGLSFPLRIARSKPLPPLGAALPPAVPFSLAGALNDFRPRDTVQGFGLYGFLWPLNTALSSHFSGYVAERARDIYLELWQQQADRFLGVRPLLQEGRLATEGAIRTYLSHQDWKSHGATNGHALPADVQRLHPQLRTRRRTGPVYERIESAWGDIFIHGGLPQYFRPAF